MGSFQSHMEGALRLNRGFTTVQSIPVCLPVTPGNHQSHAGQSKESKENLHCSAYLWQKLTDPFWRPSDARSSTPPAHIPKGQLCPEREDDPPQAASQDFSPRFSMLGTKGLNIAKMQECRPFYLV